MNFWIIIQKFILFLWCLFSNTLIFSFLLLYVELEKFIYICSKKTI